MLKPPKDQATDDLYVELAKRLIAMAEKSEPGHLVHIHVRRADGRPVSKEQLTEVHKSLAQASHNEIRSRPKFKTGDEVIELPLLLLKVIVSTDATKTGVTVEITSAEKANADSLELVTLRPSARFPAR